MASGHHSDQTIGGLIMSANTLLYSQDFYLWSQMMASLLRSQQWEQLDSVNIENLAEEIESLGRSDKNAMQSNLRVILMHLLKWEYQPEKRSRSWQVTLLEHRSRVEDSLSDSPSLGSFLDGTLVSCYASSIKMAAIETGLTLNTFPQVCPYSITQILDEDFLPGE